MSTKGHSRLKRSKEENNTAILSVLREINQQLANQTQRLHEIGLANETPIPISEQHTRCTTGLVDTTLAKSSATHGNFEDEEGDHGQNALEETKPQEEDGRFVDFLLEDFIPPQSASRNGIEYLPKEDTIASFPLHDLAASQNSRMHACDSAQQRKQHLNRHNKPDSLVALFQVATRPDRYEEAPKMLDTNGFEGSLKYRPGDLCDSIGCLKDVPVDNRLHHAAQKHGEMIQHARTTADAALVSKISDFIKQLKVLDYNELHGFHIYTFSAHEKQGHMIPLDRFDQAEDSRAPFSRLILCRGLSQMEANDQIQAAADYLAPSGSLPICRLLKKHLDPKETYGDSWAGDSTVSFQVKSFRLTRDAGTSAMEPFSGMLHDKKHRLSIESYTLQAVCERELSREDCLEPRRPNAFYTMILLVPKTYPIVASLNSTEINGYGFCMELHVLQNVLDILDRVSQHWCEIHIYMGGRFGEADTSALLQHDRHDQLLFDDITFSRSRRYFWAISALKVFEDTIACTLNNWQRIDEHFASPFAQWCAENKDEYSKVGPGMGCSPLHPKDLVEGIQARVELLETVAEGFGGMRQKIESLRIALFSASAVIETRAATQLGQNVKLLTYVSVFYLPLSFVATLWNISGMPGFNAFGVATVRIALLTYLAVFNLSNMIELGRAIYGWYKKKTLESMKSEDDPRWSSRAREFEYFRPQRSRLGPTAWYLPAYTLYRMFAKVRGLLLSTKSAQTHEEDPPHAVAHGTGSSIFGRLGGISLRNRHQETSAASCSKHGENAAPITKTHKRRRWWKQKSQQPEPDLEMSRNNDV